MRAIIARQNRSRPTVPSGRAGPGSRISHPHPVVPGRSALTWESLRPIGIFSKRRRIPRPEAAHSWCLPLLLLAAAPAWSAAPRAVDAARSVVTVRVEKAGILSFVGHNHTVAAPVAGGTVDPDGRQVDLRFHTASLRVIDENVSDKDRAEIQQTMQGPSVLDAPKFPEIEFRSSLIEPAGVGAWTVAGALTLHGQTRTVRLQVRETNGHYVGSSRFRQTDFGITPVKVAGGTIRVKDEIRIEFEIFLVR